MNKTRKQNHVIDSLFPIVLFFLFTICSIIVLLLATKVYESITDNSYRNNISRTALTYVSEKIHQSDCSSSISVDTLENTIALKVIHGGEKEGYTTYIYCHDGALKELFIRNGIAPSVDAGSFIANVTTFDATFLSTNLLQLNCSDANGNHFQTLVGLHSFIER